jgi:hypothetical protein
MMRFFKSTASKKLLSVDESATELLTLARVELDPTKVAQITSVPRYRDAINALVYRTKVAILAAHVRSAAAGKPPDVREYSIIDAFSDKAILSLPFKEQGVLINQLQDLMFRLSELEDIMATRDKDFLSKAIPSWSKGWLSTTVDDEELLTRSSLLFGVPLCTYVHGQISSLQKLANVVLYGD